MCEDHSVFPCFITHIGAYHGNRRRTSGQAAHRSIFFTCPQSAEGMIAQAALARVSPQGTVFTPRDREALVSVPAFVPADALA